jgi:hypothetical protein
MLINTVEYHGPVEIQQNIIKYTKTIQALVEIVLITYLNQSEIKKVVVCDLMMLGTVLIIDMVELKAVQHGLMLMHSKNI